jgi:ATP-dependent Clp protease adapter protein ClpS
LEIAEQKCNETIKFARKEGFPLQVDIEKLK